MRKVAVVLGGILVFNLGQPLAQAHHRPDSYCSPSGDLCLATRKVEGVRKLRILMPKAYFEWFMLCVASPDTEVCVYRRIRQLRNGIYGHTQRWPGPFAHYGPGPYTVTWRMDGNGRVIGRKLGFHVARN